MILLIFFLLTFLIIAVIYHHINKIENVIFKNNYYKNINSNLKILLTSNSLETAGGGGIHIINLYKNLLKRNIETYILVVKNSEVEKILINLQLPYYSYKKIIIRKNTIQSGLGKGIYKICKNKKINLINCHLDKEAKIARNAIRKLPTKVKIVLTHMSHLDIKSKYLSNITESNSLNGIIYASPQISKSHLKNVILNKIKNFEFIPPIFNEEKFINFKTNETKKDFFKKEFNISIKKSPIICMIAHMYKDLSHKNHTIVINAIQRLIQKNQPVQVVFAGSGARENEYKLMAEKLGISKYIHFLGHTNKIAEIIYHSDINLLASNNEAFGIVLLEGALLKRPLICATKTGAANLIVYNKKTGLLFENNNLDSLVEKIETLLNNEQLRKTLGENASQYVINNFSTQVVMQKMENFYNQVLSI